jgi:hypothetical protein
MKQNAKHTEEVLVLTNCGRAVGHRVACQVFSDFYQYDFRVYGT